MRISVILPAFNEENKVVEAIRKVEKSLIKTSFDYEIIVVNDGSKDETASKVLDYASTSSRVKLVNHPRNLGKGVAIRTGSVVSSGEFIVYMDSDLEIDPEPLQVYLRVLRYADVAIGSKWHPNSDVKISLVRKLLSRSFYALAKLLVGIKVSDTQVGLKAFRREALEKILKVQLAERYAFDTEILAIASLLELKVVELPVNINLKENFNFFEIFRMLTETLRIAFMLRILKWYKKMIANSLAHR